MPAFRFSLERVLAWRRTALEGEQAKLENLRAQLRAAENARSQLIEARLRRHQETASALVITGRDLAGLDAFRIWAAREETTLAARAADLHRAIAAQAARVVSASRDVRLLERLRERRFEAWTAEEQRHLNLLAAESAVAQWRRLNGGASPANSL